MRRADVTLGAELFAKRRNYGRGKPPIEWVPGTVDRFETSTYGTEFVIVKLADGAELRVQPRELRTQADMDKAARKTTTVESRIELVKEQLAGMGFKEKSVKGYRLKTGKFPQFVVSLEVLELLLERGAAQDTGDDDDLAEALGLT